VQGDIGARTVFQIDAETFEDQIPQHFIGGFARRPVMQLHENLIDSSEISIFQKLGLRPFDIEHQAVGVKLCNFILEAQQGNAYLPDGVAAWLQR
jgi:hypothetical protein